MSKTTIIILALSQIPLDSRVLRQCRTLSNAGHQLILIGIEGAHEGCENLPAGINVRHETIARPLWPRWQKIINALQMTAVKILPGDRAALMVAERLPGVGAIRDTLLQILRDSDVRRNCIVLVNDWNTLPAAIRAYQSHNIPFVYDTHELALSEHSEKFTWRLLFPHLIRRIEGPGCHHALAISCVSEGIARSLTDTYGFSHKPVVIRNLPHAIPLAPSKLGEQTQVLYHGLFQRNRGLETLLQSAVYWDPHLELTLRGHGSDAGYDENLYALHKKLGLKKTVTFTPMVASGEVVKKANEADIGIFLPDLSSPQIRYALPNKLFEYLHAGLMTIVPAGTEMADLVEQYNTGVCLEDPTPENLAQLLATLSPEQIAGYKARAHNAARKLTWDQEQKKLLDFVEPALKTVARSNA